MIEQTFLHLPRVGETTEQNLWSSGVKTWADFLSADKVKRFSKEKKAASDNILKQSQTALARGDSSFFLSLPSTAHWRLWPSFNEETLYVDIETNWHHDITVLGIYDGNEVKQFVKGQNLNRQAVEKHLKGKLFVTYNGASFDMPIIKRFFGSIVKPTPHFDTMHLARRLGYTGGLKILEQQLGITRPKDVEGMSGEDALHLWDLYQASGEQEYLQRLLAYNEEDIVNLQRVARLLVEQARRSST